MQISSATWNVMSRLLDEALDLERLRAQRA